MLYETLLGGYVFACLLFCGIVAGIVLEVFNLIESSLKKIKLLQILINALASFAVAVILFLAVNMFNYGEYRLYLLIAFVLGIVLERLTVGQIVANISFFMYNCFKKVAKFLNKLPFLKHNQKGNG